MRVADRTQARCRCGDCREFGGSRRHASAEGDGIENDGYKYRGSADLPRRLRDRHCLSCAGSIQVELLHSLSCLPVDLFQCRMGRFLDCLDDSIGCVDTVDGRSLRFDCPALDIGFHCRRVWNLDLPDVSGLSAKTFQTANRG